MQHRFCTWIVIVLWVLCASGQQCFLADAQAPRVYGYKVKAEYPHDKDAFTQGLQYDKECTSNTTPSGTVEQQCKDIYWESTGLRGQSTLRKVDLVTGKVLQSLPLSRVWFAEGCVKHQDTIYQLTWQSGTIFKYSVGPGNTITALGSISGPLRDGWGLTTDGTHLIASDSSEVISFIDPANMQVVRQITVTDGGTPIRWMNELEVVEGELWGNIWQTDCIARVNMSSGVVNAWIILSGLKHGLHQRHPEQHMMDVLNGADFVGKQSPLFSSKQDVPCVYHNISSSCARCIAYDSEGKRLFVTGKKWPMLFEIEPHAHIGPHVGMTLAQIRMLCHR